MGIWRLVEFLQGWWLLDVIFLIKSTSFGRDFSSLVYMCVSIIYQRKQLTQLLIFLRQGLTM
jgi:hypothetical protein